VSDEASSKATRKPGDSPGVDLKGKKSYSPDPHRLLPQSPDAEKGVLSSFLIASRDIGGLCAEKQVTKDHFFIPAHSLIYETLIGMWDRNEPIDFITLTQLLRDRGQLDQCGGAAFVTELFTFLPTAANAAYYIEILQEKYTLREIIKICTEFAARSYDEQDDVPNLLDKVETEIFKVAQDRFRDQAANMKQLVVQAIGAIEELYSRRGSITGLSTGFDIFDKMTDGLHGAEMIVVAARPSMGKTALAMNMAEHIAIELKKAIAVFSLEMSSQQLVQRLLCSRARVNLGRVRDGFLSERDFPALQTAASKLAESKIFIDDTSGLTILELRAKARRLKSQHDIQAIFIDYLQLLRSATKRAQDNRQLEIAEISSGLKALAKELNIPVVVLAQLNRNPEQRTGDSRGRPRLSDLRESGSIEQDADLVGLLVREEYYADSDEEKKEVAGKATLIIAKQRNGPVGDVPLTFLKEYTRFENRAEEEGGEG
jgi:replicative DNA helicase